VLREQFLNVSLAERERDIKPNCVPDDRRSKLVTSERMVLICHFTSALSIRVGVTMPLLGQRHGSVGVKSFNQTSANDLEPTARNPATSI
jgi:hypothetical protein